MMTHVASYLQTKSGQLIGSRPDLFPEPYTRKLAPLQDSIPPMDGALLVRVVETELLGGAPLSSMFSAFDAEPLGSASVAQVHRAVLRADGRVVAVKVQRPSIMPLMLGDVANVKALAAQVRGRFPVDYYWTTTPSSASWRRSWRTSSTSSAKRRA